jgi:hypothetical protein
MDVDLKGINVRAVNSKSRLSFEIFWFVYRDDGLDIRIIKCQPI